MEYIYVDCQLSGTVLHLLYKGELSNSMCGCVAHDKYPCLVSISLTNNADLASKQNQFFTLVINSLCTTPILAKMRAKGRPHGVH